MFRVIFVLDIFNGNAVHAVRGERSNYLAIRKSSICTSSNPLEIISALEPEEVYIADLNRLQFAGDNFDLIKKISARCNTMVDIGVESVHDIEKGVKIADTVILGTETSSLELIDRAAKQFSGFISVSIDIKNGKVLTKDRNMMVVPQRLIKMLNKYDINDIIILDLDKVGTGAGIDPEFLRDMAGLSNHSVLAGGGIRDMNDINALKETGISGALVATAVHSGRIPVELLRVKR